VVCDGLKGLPDSITTCWPLATVQACVIHLLRNTFRFASRKYWDAMAKDLQPVYTAANEASALARFQEFDDQWGQRYPAITRMWRSAWTEFAAVPGLRRRGQTRHLPPPTPSRVSTPATAGRSAPVGTSRRRPP